MGRIPIGAIASLRMVAVLNFVLFWPFLATLECLCSAGRASARPLSIQRRDARAGGLDWSLFQDQVLGYLAATICCGFAAASNSGPSMSEA